MTEPVENTQIDQTNESTIPEGKEDVVPSTNESTTAEELVKEDAGDITAQVPSQEQLAKWKEYIMGLAPNDRNKLLANLQRMDNINSDNKTFKQVSEKKVMTLQEKLREKINSSKSSRMTKQSRLQIKDKMQDQLKEQLTEMKKAQEKKDNDITEYIKKEEPVENPDQQDMKVEEPVKTPVGQEGQEGQDEQQSGKEPKTKPKLSAAARKFKGRRK